MYSIYDGEKLRFLVSTEKQAEWLVSEISLIENKDAYYESYKRIDKKYKKFYNKSMKKAEWLRKKLTPEERLGILKRKKKFLDKEIDFWQDNYIKRGFRLKSELYETLSALSDEELDEAKIIISDLSKERKSAVKEAMADKVKSTIEPGDEVAFVFKDTEVFGTVTKLNEKSFTAEFDWEGDIVTKPIQFQKFVGKADQEVAV